MSGTRGRRRSRSSAPPCRTGSRPPSPPQAVQQDAAHAGYDVVIYSVDVPHGGSRELFAHYLRAIRRKRHDAVIVAVRELVQTAARVDRRLDR